MFVSQSPEPKHVKKKRRNSEPVSVTKGSKKKKDDEYESDPGRDDGT
jgi:hypothetical protein